MLLLQWGESGGVHRGVHGGRGLRREQSLHAVPIASMPWDSAVPILM